MSLLSGTPQPTRQHSETPICISSIRSGSEASLPKVSIAHYGQHQFYETWFTCDKDRLEFLRNTLAWPCWGDPTFTYSDVERAIKQQVRARNYVALYELRATEELRDAEMAVLVRLEAKYRPPLAQVVPATPVQSITVATELSSPEPLSSPIQGSLF